MKTELKVGDKVRVLDKGLLMLQQFAPKGAKPNNEGVVSEILEDGALLIEFPIGDDDPKKHSQAAPYPANICVKIEQNSMPDLQPEYRGPAHHCKACENEAKGIKHIKAEKHTCRKKNK